MDGRTVCRATRDQSSASLMAALSSAPTHGDSRLALLLQEKERLPFIKDCLASAEW